MVAVRGARVLRRALAEDECGLVSRRLAEALDFGAGCFQLGGDEEEMFAELRAVGGG